MKRIVLFVVAAFCLSACVTDLSDIEKKIEEVEKQGKDLEKANQELQQESDKLKQQGEKLEAEAKRRQEENEKIQQRLLALEEYEDPVEPKLLSMEFVAAENPLLLIENTPCTIIGDSVVECRILNISTYDKLLIPRFTFQGSVVTINGVEAESGVTQFNFNHTVVLSVITAHEIKDYLVYVGSYTGLPSVWLETNGHVNIVFTNQYYGGYIKVVNSAMTRAASDIVQSSVKILGLDSIEWYRPKVSDDLQLAKNTYAIRFSSDISLLDDPKGDAWRLMPNKGDMTMLHNQTAFYMGRLSCLEYTPRSHYVDMFMNGRYFGTYLMEEQLQISESKVNVGNGGFILSIGSNAPGTIFSTDHLDREVKVIDPATTPDDDYAYICNFVGTAEEVLFSSNFTSASSGWQKYLDMDSFVDWYLINEIAKNPNGAFKANCVMNLKRGGKLKMGPLLDFEEAFGDVNEISTSGFVIRNASWYARLFQDPAFVARVKERFTYFYDHRQDIVSEINANAAYLKDAIKEDNNKWDTFSDYKYVSSDSWVIYESLVANMKIWLLDRMDWLKGEFDAMD